MIFNTEKVNQVKEVLKTANNIVIVAHRSPDGDSVGSSVGLYHYLKKKNLQVNICHPDPAPYFLEWMKGTEQIKNAEEHNDFVLKQIEEADVIFCLDFNSMSRTGMLEQPLIDAKATKIMIDHHLHPSNEFDILFSDTSSCATAQMIADFIHAMGDDELLDVNIGNALYCGIMTDSGSFRFSSVTSHTHNIIARLMEYGVEPYVVHESVFDTNTFDKLRLHAYTVNEKTEILKEHNTAIMSLTKEELAEYNYTKGDTEGLVNVGLSIIGVRKSIFLSEQDGIIKISFRSKGKDNPVNTMAGTYFHGGGHANAAGGKWVGSMEEAIKKIKEVLPEFD